MFGENLGGVGEGSSCLVWSEAFQCIWALPILQLVWGVSAIKRFAAKKKAYTTTTERNRFGELFWPQRKTFQAGGGYKNLIKTTKTISTTEIFPLWTSFFSAKKSSALEQGGVRFLFPSFVPKVLVNIQRASLAKTTVGPIAPGDSNRGSDTTDACCFSFETQSEAPSHAKGTMDIGDAREQFKSRYV